MHVQNWPVERSVASGKINASTIQGASSGARQKDLGLTRRR
jgi:hypothetical protein